MYFSATALAIPHIKTGKLKGMAVSGDTRLQPCRICRPSPRPVCRVTR